MLSAQAHLRAAPFARGPPTRHATKQHLCVRATAEKETFSPAPRRAALIMLAAAAAGTVSLPALASVAKEDVKEVSVRPRLRSPLSRRSRKCRPAPAASRTNSLPVTSAQTRHFGSPLPSRILLIQGCMRHPTAQTETATAVLKPTKGSGEISGTIVFHQYVNSTGRRFVRFGKLFTC